MDTIISIERIFVPVMLFFWLWLLIRTAWKPQRYFNSILLMTALFFTLLSVAGLFGENMGYVLLYIFLGCMLALFLVPIILIANGIHLLRKERVCLAHMLSLLLGVGIAVGEGALAFYVIHAGNYESLYLLNKALYLFGMTVFYFSVLMLNFVLYSVFIQVLPHRARFDYIIIHGCGLLPDGSLSPLLKGRVDKAMALYNRCRKKPMIVASGGKGGDEILSEAQGMYNYMVAGGIPPEHIILEDRSATTWENVLFSKEIIDSREGRKRTALVSSDYHIYRCLTYAKKLKLRCVGIGARVAQYYWPSALIREFVAVFRQKRYVICSLLGYVVFMLIMALPLYG